MMTDSMADKDEIARQYGFETYAELLAISKPVPNQSGETVRSYVARRQNGDWFIWDDKPPPADSPRS